MATSDSILAVLDACSDNFTFPMLDNGYVYPAASRLAVYRSPKDWAIVIEIFGFSPRAGVPDISVYTFASRLINRDSREDYVDDGAFRNYLTNNPHNEMSSVFPVAKGDWQHPEDPEWISPQGKHIHLRGEAIPLPNRDLYGNSGVELCDDSTIHVFECCRYLAENFRELVLCWEQERRTNVPDELSEMMLLDEWFHPDLIEGEKPSECETFQQIAFVLETGERMKYDPTHSPNNHWSNWPEGGTL